MGIILIAIVSILFLVYIMMLSNRISVDWPSIPAKTLALDMGVFGVYCFTGKQGSGKTYSLTKYVIKHAKGKKIYSNLTISGIEYTKIRDVQHLLSLRNEGNLYIIFDEIFTLLNDKTIPKDIRDPLMEFLSQQRKMKNIMLTTAQEWLNIPIEFRRFVRIQVECLTRPLGKLGGLLVEEYFDAYSIKWSNEENEYISPRISKKFSKYEKKYMERYDTYERIKGLERVKKEDKLQKNI